MCPQVDSVASQVAWDELNAQLPILVEQLLEAQPFNASSPPKHQGRGIYLFSEGSRHLYVGRTSVTARSRQPGKEPSTSFSARWKQQTGEKSPPNAAPLATKLTREVADHFGLELPTDLKKQGKIDRVSNWWKLREEEPPPDFYLAFQAAKQFVRESLDFRFVELNDDVRGVRSHVAEVYVDVVLQTTYGDFSTS